MAESEQIEKHPIPTRVLGVAAHADDLDYMASGTIAAWAGAGSEVYYLILTSGDKGTSDRSLAPAELIRLRQDEQREAARILGVKDVFFCAYEDGMLQPTADVKRDIVRAIRRTRPEAVVTVDPTMVYSVDKSFINHSDHRAAGQAAIDAVYPLARDHLSFPELCKDEGLEPHKVSSLYLTHFGKENHYVDITGTIDMKLAALRAHASQMGDMEQVETLVRTSAAELGEQAGVEYAEGFVYIKIK